MFSLAVAVGIDVVGIGVNWRLRLHETLVQDLNDVVIADFL